MSGFRKILALSAVALRDRRGVSSLEYSILAVGVAVVVGAAVVQFSLNDPLSYAGSALTAGQGSLASAAR
jgi:Flp pilus assembly pilin Flp